MLFYTLAVLSSAYSVFAICFLITHLYMKRTYGLPAYNEKINKLAKTKTIVVFEIYSYLSCAIWLALVLPWVDLFTFHFVSNFKDDRVITYFGSMTYHQADIAFIVAFFNILGVKAAMNLAEVADILRRGRVRMIQIPRGMMLWKPE